MTEGRTNPLTRERTLMHQRIQKFSEIDLKIIWMALNEGGYDPEGLYAIGITMEDWAQAIYTEMTKRGFNTRYWRMYNERRT
jgi:hypothetical protein